MPAARPKHISLVISGSGQQFTDVEVTRGLTTRDLLQQMNLTGHLSKFGDPVPFGENEDLYTRVEDGDKLIVGPSTPVA